MAAPVTFNSLDQIEPAWSLLQSAGADVVLFPLDNADTPSELLVDHITQPACLTGSDPVYWEAYQVQARHSVTPVEACVHQKDNTEEGQSSGTTEDAASGDNQGARQTVKSLDATKRFRLRQKARKLEMERLLEDKLSEFARLKAENEFLRHKLKLLETLVPCRDEHVAFLSHASRLKNLPGGNPLNHQSASSTPQSQSSNHSQPASQAAGFFSLTYSNSAPDMYSSVVKFSPGQLSLEEVDKARKVGPQEFQIFWKAFVRDISVYVAALDAHKSANYAAVKLNDALEEMYKRIDAIFLLRPDAWQQSMYVNMETGYHERPSEEFWKDVAASLTLTAEQHKEVQTCVQMFHKSLSPIVEERRQLTEQLALSLSSKTNLPGHAHSDLAVQVEELTQKLERNVLKEQSAHIDAGDFLCLTTLTAHQVAKACVVSYPYFPDGVAILLALSQKGSGYVSSA